MAHCKLLLVDREVGNEIEGVPTIPLPEVRGLCFAVDFLPNMVCC